MRLNMIILTIIMMLMFSCSTQPETQNGTVQDTVNNQTVDTAVVADTTVTLPEFIPPDDNLITEDMAERYIACAVDIHSLIKDRADQGKQYLDSVGVDIEQLSDTSFIANNKDIYETYNQITSGPAFTTAEQEIYITNNISEDEFIWIASHLSDPENQEIQRKVAEALSEIIGP